MSGEWIYLLVGFLAGGGILWLYARWERGNLFQRIENLKEALSQKKTELAQLSERLDQEKRLREKLEAERAQFGEKFEGAQKELAQREAEIAKLRERIAREEEHFREKLEIIEKAQKELEKTFKAISSEIFQKNTESFLKLAQDRLSGFREEIQGQLKAKEEALERLTHPLKEALEKVNREIREMEEKRERAYTSLKEGLRNLVEVYLPRLQKETENLSRALRQPRIRGKWGEIQLKRVVEMAGMLPKCDFEEQPSFLTGERSLRPDMIIRLPGGRLIAVDAKVPFELYMEALEEEDEEKSHRKLREYINHLKNHIKNLSQKRYWEAIESRWQRSPEFVILFLPAEGLLAAALKTDPEIVEFGARHKVLPATPITLIAVLKAVAYAWQEHELAENAREIARLGNELYHRLKILTEHFNDLGTRLRQTVEAYNKTVRSYESRILVTARKFENFRLISPEKKIPESKEVSIY